MKDNKMVTKPTLYFKSYLEAKQLWRDQILLMAVEIVLVSSCPPRPLSVKLSWHYMILSKLLNGIVKVLTWICQSFSWICQSCCMYFLPFAKENHGEGWPRFRRLLKLLLWKKGIDWVKALKPWVRCFGDTLYLTLPHRLEVRLALWLS